MKNILVGVDFNDQTEVLIEKAKNLAKDYGAKLWLLHVIAPLPEYIGFDVTLQYSTESIESNKEFERKKLDVYTNQLKDSGIEVEGILMYGGTTDLILKESKELNVDLIICGHHEHNFLYKMLFGSVSAAVVRNSEIPVLVFPLKTN